MPYEDPDHEDPMELMGVEIEATEESTLEMIACFAEEFARTGYDSAAILELFRNPEYTAAHGALKQMGEGKVRRMIEEAVFIYGGRKAETVFPAPFRDAGLGLKGCSGCTGHCPHSEMNADERMKS